MRRILMLLALSLFLFEVVSGQTQVITGRVLDAQGKPIPYASVTVRGTRTGVSADENGNFSIQAAPNSVLVISAAGFQQAEVNVGTQTTVTTTLTNQNNLNEVVVTALGQTRSRAKVGYSSTTINNENLNRAAPVNLFENLGGKVAGAEISQTGGPG